MPLHKTPLCSFKYVGQSVSSSATFKYDTVSKLSKSAEVKIYHGEGREIVKVDPKELHCDLGVINIDRSKVLNSENHVIVIDQSKELYGETNIINVERSKELYDHDEMMITVESSKGLCNRIIRIIDKNKPKIMYDQLIEINKLNLKQMYTNIIGITKNHNKYFYRFRMEIKKEYLKSMGLDHNLLIDLNVANGYENIDDYREISTINQMSLTHVINHEISNISDEKSLIVKSIAPYLNKSDQIILDINRSTEMNISTGLEVSWIKDHEINKYDDYSMSRDNVSFIDQVESAKNLTKHAIFRLDKSDQINLSNISTVNMIYDELGQHYLNYGSLMNIKGMDLAKTKLLKLENTFDLSKSNDPKGVNTSVVIDINLFENDRIIDNVAITDIFKTNNVGLNQIRGEDIQINDSTHSIEHIAATLSITDDKTLDRITHYDIDKTIGIELNYDMYSEISLSDQSKYLGNESEILINYSNFKNVISINPNSNIAKSDDKELDHIKDVKSIFLSDAFSLSHGTSHLINKEISLEMAASHFDELNKIDNMNLSKGYPKGIFKDLSKFVGKFGKIIDKVSKNKFVYKSNTLIDRFEPVMVQPYGPIEVFKNKNRIMYKTYKLLGKIDDLKALNKGHKTITVIDNDRSLDKSEIPIFNYINDKWLTKGKLNIFTDKQKFIDETPLNITLNQGSFLSKDRIDIFTQDSRSMYRERMNVFIKDPKPMYRERMNIRYKVITPSLEVTKRWWVLGSHGPYDQKILPFDYGYSKQPLWINRRDRELGGHFMKLKNHPISYMPYLESNKGKDLNYGTHEIELSIEIMLDMANILTMIFKHSSSQFANCSGQEAIEFIMELFFDWLNLESTKDEMARKGSRSHYLRCYRWFRWEAEKVWFIANNDHIQDRMHGIKYAGMLVRNVLEYMKNHHFNMVPLWRNITFMDIERQFDRSATNGDLMKDLDKLKGKRHYFIENKNLGGNK